MRTFEIEPEALDVDHRALVWVTPAGNFVFSVVQAADTKKYVRLGGIYNPVDQLPEERPEWMDRPEWFGELKELVERIVEGALANHISSVDDLLALTHDLIAWDRIPDQFRAIRAEGHARRFTESQRRLLDRIAI